jgi:hypothetical protein
MRFQRQQDVPGVRLGQAISNYFLDVRPPAVGTASPSRGSSECFSLPPTLKRKTLFTPKRQGYYDYRIELNVMKSAGRPRKLVSDSAGFI